MLVVVRFYINRGKGGSLLGALIVGKRQNVGQGASKNVGARNWF